jgi:indolepyruvate ferredoxin oxidoreductase
MLQLSIEAAAGAEASDFLEATRLATGLMGDSIATNLFMLGYAYQKGLIPIGHEALERAIELNATAVPMNLGAFRWGRRAAHDRAAVEKLVAPAADNVVPFARPSTTLEDIVAARVKLLIGYQDTRLAERYGALVERVRKVEDQRGAIGSSGGGTRLAVAVARNYAKLLAYKDEYEVARLYAEAAFAAGLDQQFEGDYRLKFHLAPPLFAKRDPRTGHLIKAEFGAWMLRPSNLAKLSSCARTSSTCSVTARSARPNALIEQYEALVATARGPRARQPRAGRRSPRCPTRSAVTAT